MPLMGVYSYFRLKSGKLLAPKKRRYASMIALQCLLLVMSWEVTHQNRLQFFFNTSGLAAWMWIASAAWLALVALRLKSGWRRITPERRQRARLSLPENTSDLRYWIPISLLAGIAEEWAYRGVAYVMLWRTTRSQALSVLVCVLAFGTAHMFQGWRGVLGTSLLAVFFHGLVYFTQTLYLVMAIHAAYDVIVGVIGMRMLGGETAASVPETQAAS